MIFSWDKQPPNQYSPLVLAFIGDAVHNLYVRSRVVSQSNMSVHKMHTQSTAFVKAKAQCSAYHAIEDTLSQEEIAVFKRGRNAKSATVPKNADVTEYRHATGFEALLGYLYIKGEQERLEQILDMAYDAMNQPKTE